MRRALSACGYALVTSLVVFGPFFIGFRIYWQRLGFLSPDAHFHVPWTPRAFGSDVAAQLLMVALPEEAFYRGYLQSRFTLALDGVGHRGRTAGAIFITSAIFAVGHFVTIHHPQRLAVFFPSILFGLLRVRTKGIGSSVLFHALCNLFSEMLGKGFGVFA